MRNFEVRIVEDGVEKDINEIGEIQVKGEAVMKGYYQYGKICRNSFDNGWFNTGDIGYIDSNGYLYIKGRIKNIIIVAGKNIYPEEVEDILMKNENILFAHVYAIPSKITNEKVVADICVRSGAFISLKAVMEFCRKNMDKYMIPNEIHFVTQQSINFSGKLCRK